MPFKFGPAIIEKEVKFLFNLSALETATNEILECDIWQVSEIEPARLNVAILYAGYLTACRKDYRKPKYKEVHAAYWISHMSQESTTEFVRSINELMGKMKSKGGEEKKK